MTYTITDRTIALAGIFQATQLVQNIANTGNADEQDVETCILSIFRTDIDKPVDVFDGTEKLHMGLRKLIEQLGGRDTNDTNDANDTNTQSSQNKDLHVTKYAAGVMVLEKRLKRDADMLAKIADGIEHARKQMEHFSLLHDNVIANLADTYAQTISHLKPRIMVQGEHIYISNPNNANRIRTLLLAAIRATVLWRQCGGTRWQLLFQRRTIVDEARRLLKEPLITE
ncbi:MAG: high frequency lysogenization protein HflD [Gammaproteobacteria bacterium]|nr:high frequency lysogenization protein HflD [Gammaproteobacteria bacterium]MCF6261492.1 high frequency lysogenization protein HflD [Gammaproteobacteria bacterium]